MKNKNKVYRHSTVEPSLFTETGYVESVGFPHKQQTSGEKRKSDDQNKRHPSTFRGL